MQIQSEKRSAACLLFTCKVTKKNYLYKFHVKKENLSPQTAHIYSFSHNCSFLSLPPGRLVPFKQADIMLKPLLFEVPGITAETPFIGRDWLFTRLEEVLRKTSSCEGRGAVIVGNAGSGKTAIMWRLVTLSCHSMHTAQGGSSIPHSPSSSPKCEHPMFTHNRLICRFVCISKQSCIPEASCVLLQIQIVAEYEKISLFGTQSVTGLHTLLSSPPLRFPCWLQLCKRTEIVFFFFSLSELVFCLKNNVEKKQLIWCFLCCILLIFIYE